MKYKFQQFSPKSYQLLEQVICRYIANDSIILDVGAGEGAVADIIERHNTGCTIFCLEPDVDALGSLAEKRYERNIVVPRPGTFHDYLVSTERVKSQCTIFHRSLHEAIDDLDELDQLDGMVILGDPYIHPCVPDEEYQRVAEELRFLTGHADPRDKFFDPTQVVLSTIQHGFNLLFFDLIWETPGVRQYYQIVLDKSQT